MMVEEICDRCGSQRVYEKGVPTELKPGAGRGGAEIRWDCAYSERSSHGVGSGRKETGTAWLCVECSKAFFSFMVQPVIEAARKQACNNEAIAQQLVQDLFKHGKTR